MKSHQACCAPFFLLSKTIITLFYEVLAAKDDSLAPASYDPRKVIFILFSCYTLSS